jgi:hypothetical protein
MFSFYVIVALSLALLYAHRKRFGFLGELLKKFREPQERALSVPTDTAIKIEEISLEIKRLNELVGGLPDLIISDLREHLNQERDFRIKMLTNQEGMKTRLENFNAAARVLLKPASNSKEIGNIDLPQSVANKSDRMAVVERNYEVPSIATEVTMTPAPVALSAALTSDLEEFVHQNIEQINRAGYEGLKGIRSFLENSEIAIELHSPSDGIVVLTEREAGPGPEGRAFVLPGQLLGRPWVEWFEVPRELVHPIEATVWPAIVFGRNDGTWELRKKGRVSQQ